MGAAIPAAGSEGVLYVVDLSGYVFRAYHAIAPLSSSRGEPTHAVLGTVNMLQRVVNERRPSHLAIAMDSRTPSFRKALDDRYKANRPPAPPDLKQQMARCEEIVRAYRIPVYQRDGLEADDLIAALTHRAVDAGLTVVIVSADKDLMQLVHDDDERVLLWDSMRDRVFGPAEVEAKWGVRPSQLRDLLALTGDSSDNVPGVPGVGPKTAATLLRDYGSFDGVYAALDRIPRAKLKESLATHEADARLSRDLVSLRDDEHVELDLDALRYGGADREELIRIYSELELSRQLEQLGHVARPAASAPARVEAPELPTSAVAETVAVVLDEAALEALCQQAREAGVVALAVGTTPAGAMEAELLGVALSVEPSHAVYVPIGHRYLGAPKQLAAEIVRRHLDALLGDASVRKVAHDLKRVEVVLARSAAAMVGPISDPMLAAYLLDPEAPHALFDLARRELSLELGDPHAIGGRSKKDQVPFDQADVEQAAALLAPHAAAARALSGRLDARVREDGMGDLYESVELPLSRVLAAMERTGVLVDVSMLAAASANAAAEMARIEAEAHRALGRPFSLRSRDQLEAILFDELSLPSLKRTPKGGRSTDAAVLEELADQHPLPALILDYRELDKLRGTYLEALPRCVNAATGRIHTRFDQATAATGRLSSSDPNLQNIPIRTELGREIRKAFVAPPGMVLVSADYSQIELRVLAHLSRDEALIEAFATGGDVHRHTAARIFDVPLGEVTDEMRRRAKTINFGVIYGMGDARLARQLGISRDEAKSFIAAYFERYSGVKRFMDETVEGAKRGEAVRTLLGRRRFLPNLSSSNRGLRFEAERVAKNTPIQGTAADILKVAMVKLGASELVAGARMILTVHDELVFEVPEGRADEAASLAKSAMETAVELSVPLDVGVGVGPNWGAAH